MKTEQQIFRQGSKTYYHSALLFPRRTREDIVQLYSFLRVADDYVDSSPQRLDEFRNLTAVWQQHRSKPLRQLAPDARDSLNVRVTKNICRLVVRHQFELPWVDAFLGAMDADTKPAVYKTLDDTLRYVHGSAEVVGLMVARLMNLPPESMAAAAAQGRAMQYINFLRDIAEDSALGRCYFPEADLERFDLRGISEPDALAQPEPFKKFVRFELQRYEAWQAEARPGLSALPKRYRVPLLAATDAYAWTAKQIVRDPFVVYRRKVKPSTGQIIGRALVRVFT